MIFLYIFFIFAYFLFGTLVLIAVSEFINSKILRILAWILWPITLIIIAIVGLFVIADNYINS